MEDNSEAMEGKDLAKEQKKEFERKILEAIKELKTNQTTVSIEGIEVTKYANGQAVIKMRGIEFGIINEDGSFTYNKEKFVELKKALAEEGIELEETGLPDLEQEIDKEEKAKKEEQERNAEPKEQENNQEDEEQEGEKDDDKPELEDEGTDLQKEEIAKEYNVNGSQVVHLSKNKKITREGTLDNLTNWSGNYDDVFIIPGEDEYSKKFIGIKDGKKEEIENAGKKIGSNLSITIKKVTDEGITEVTPVAMYQIENGAAIAIVRNEHGQTESLYCRQEGGKGLEYWGSVIPEAEGKNVKQDDIETREIMDYKVNSNLDLEEKGRALERQNRLEKQGMPSKKNGVQVGEINGTTGQNREANLEEIVKELMSRDGIIDKITVPPGYYERKAEKVLTLMEQDENLSYENAIEQIENEGKREEGGRQPGEPRNRR